jgi:hypothetical protein
MKLSLFYELTTADPDVPGAVKQRLDEALEQIQLADKLGFWASTPYGRWSTTFCRDTPTCPVQNSS